MCKNLNYLRRNKVVGTDRGGINKPFQPNIYPCYQIKSIVTSRMSKKENIRSQGKILHNKGYEKIHHEKVRTNTHLKRR